MQSKECPKDQFRCHDDMCVDRKMMCDGVVHCYGAFDEIYCPWYKPYIQEKVSTVYARQLAIRWLQAQGSDNKPTTEKWGNQVARIAVALYLADREFFSPGNRTGKEIAYELNIQLLAAHLRNETQQLPSSELALYIHAAIVTCLEPRNLQGVDFVAILRRRVNAETSYTNPFVLLTLCNARDNITSRDVDKLTALTKSSHRTSMTNIWALTLMALSCISQKSNIKVDPNVITELSWKLKHRQNLHGEIETLRTTALVMQALFASEHVQGGVWDEMAAFRYMMRNQIPDGSFGDLLNTYYILPVLYRKSLLNVSSSHCRTYHEEAYEPSSLGNYRNVLNSNTHIKYSLWIGDKVDVVRSVEFRTVANNTLFNIMNMAANIDNSFRFSYNVVNSTYCVYSVSGIEEDPESDKYWFFYRLGKVEKIMKALDCSPGQVNVEDGDEFILWYKTAQWPQEQAKR